MKQIIIIILIFGLLGSFLKAQKKFQIKAELAKTQYIIGERIDLGLELKNISNSTFKDNLSYSVNVKISNQNGKEIPLQGPSGDFFSPPKYDFNVNEKCYWYIQLSDFFGKTLSEVTTSRYLDAGKYTIKVSFKPPHSQEITTHISFQVIKPSGDELIVFNSLLQIYSNVYLHKYKGSGYPEALYNLHISHPNSVYSPELLDVSSSYYFFFLNDRNKSDLIRTELVEKYPWSPMGKGMLLKILKNMTSNKERADYIMKILPGSKNYPMHKILEKHLTDLKNNTWR